MTNETRFFEQRFESIKKRQIIIFNDLYNEYLMFLDKKTAIPSKRNFKNALIKYFKSEIISFKICRFENVTVQVVYIQKKPFTTNLFDKLMFSMFSIIKKVKLSRTTPIIKVN